MKTTDILSQEHRVIEQVLSCLEEFISVPPAPGHCDWESAQQMLDFFREFADGCHHAKEESALFPAMEARGFSPSQGPTAVMRGEHEQGRRLMGAMADAVRRGLDQEPDAFAAFRSAARGYIQLLRAHIQKEDGCLFPMANNFLGEADDCALLEQFERTEHAPGFEGEHEKFLALADELADRFGVARATATKTCRMACGCHH
jgi:hemerythrin-like domain-containing protein